MARWRRAGGENRWGEMRWIHEEKKKVTTRGGYNRKETLEHEHKTHKGGKKLEAGRRGRSAAKTYLAKKQTNPVKGGREKKVVIEKSKG